MHWERVSEWDFLLTELEYTLAQIDVQLDGITGEAFASILGQERSPNEILASMLRYEADYQARYREELHLTAGELRRDEVGSDGDRATFAKLRARTINILRQIAADPSEELVGTVRQQLHEDRKHVTALAECRYHLAARSTGQNDS